MALSQQQPLADMLQLISFLLRSAR